MIENLPTVEPEDIQIASSQVQNLLQISHLYMGFKKNMPTKS